MSPTATDPASAGRDLFLRLVDEFPTSARELVRTWHAMSRREQDLALLDLQRRRPGLLDEVINGVASISCLGCGHSRHPGQTCGAGYIDVDGKERLCCWCSPSSAANAFGLGVLDQRAGAET